jgi:hypothetical protein
VKIVVLQIHQRVPGSHFLVATLQSSTPAETPGCNRDAHFQLPIRYIGFKSFKELGFWQGQNRRDPIRSISEWVGGGGGGGEVM